MEGNTQTEILLETISEEISGLKNVLSEQVAIINKMETVLVSVVEKIAKPVSIVQQNVDLKPVIGAIQLGNQKIERLIDAQPKNVTRKIQLLHYPTEYAKGIYNRILGWITLALVSMLIVICIFKYYKFKAPLQMQIQKQALENDRMHIAWKQLYDAVDTKGKKKMDSLASMGLKVLDIN